MDDLITIEMTNIGKQKINSVDARELHEFLGSKQEFAHWVKAKVVNNPYFQENQDYALRDNIVRQTGRGGHNRIDYTVSIDTAKKVSMAEQTQRGDEVRDYFIKCEEVAKQKSLGIPQNYAEALRLAADQQEQIQGLEEQKKLDAPKVEFARVVEGTNAKMLIGDFAKLSGKIGRNTLFKRMREKGILMKNNAPYQRYIDSGYFETSEIIIKKPDQDIIKTTTYLTGKGQVWVSTKIKEWL